MSELDHDGAFSMNRALQDWLASPLGVQLRQQEQGVVAEALENVFGFQLLQVGNWGEPGAFFQAARTQRQAIIATGVGGVQVCCRPSELAVATDSVDAVLLPHTLEFEDDPYAVLREAGRVLVGEGKLIVLGFNPFSVWGPRHWLSRRGSPPGLKRLLSERRLRDWLALLGFEVAAVRPYAFQLPWPMPPNAYLLKAHKRLYAPLPKRARRREKRSLVGGLVKPTTRIAQKGRHESG